MAWLALVPLAVNTPPPIPVPAPPTDAFESKIAAGTPTDDVMFSLCVVPAGPVDRFVWQVPPRKYSAQSLARVVVRDGQVTDVAPAAAMVPADTSMDGDSPASLHTPCPTAQKPLTVLENVTVALGSELVASTFHSEAWTNPGAGTAWICEGPTCTGCVAVELPVTVGLAPSETTDTTYRHMCPAPAPGSIVIDWLGFCEPPLLAELATL